MICTRVFGAALVLVCAAGAQDMVEHAAGVANATSTTGMRSAGRGVASAMDKVVKTLDQAAASSPGKAAASSPGAAAAVVLSGPAEKRDPPARFTAPDPALICAGMDRQELIRKFGQPAMKTSGTEASAAVETWWYGSDPETVTVRIVDGKVLTVLPPAHPAPASRKPDTTVTVLP